MIMDKFSSFPTNNKTICKYDIHKLEFYNCVKNDGIIVIENNRIIKIKKNQNLSVDLLFDKNASVFLDSDKNVYKTSQTISEFNLL